MEKLGKLFGCGGLFFGWLRFGLAVLSVKLFDTPRCIDKFLFTSIERMAF